MYSRNADKLAIVYHKIRLTGLRAFLAIDVNIRSISHLCPHL